MNTTNTPSTPVATGDNTTAAGRTWPGTSEWNDDDYKQFVHLYSQDAFPELRTDPCAWDQAFIPAGDGSKSERPTPSIPSQETRPPAQTTVVNPELLRENTENGTDF